MIWRYKQFISIPVWCDWKCAKCGSPSAILIISIPVWCDWKRSDSTLCLRPIQFQFQYGAIERMQCYEFPWYLCYFNSSMVRLKDCYLTRNNIIQTPFQFQYGAIESAKNSMFWSSNPAFQFQYGAIEREKNFKGQFFWHHFNSSMVRLKGTFIRKIHVMTYLNFNSSMVRLKVSPNTTLKMG